MTLAFLLFSLCSLSLPPPPQTQHISPPLARLRSASEFCLRVRQRRLTEAEGRDQPPIEPASPLLIYCHANNEDLGACSQKYKLCVCVRGCVCVCVCVYIYIICIYLNIIHMLTVRTWVRVLKSTNLYVCIYDMYNTHTHTHIHTHTHKHSHCHATVGIWVRVLKSTNLYFYILYVHI
jgi:hypothetical protein